MLPWLWNKIVSCYENRWWLIDNWNLTDSSFYYYVMIALFLYIHFWWYLDINIFLATDFYPAKRMWTDMEFLSYITTGNCPDCGFIALENANGWQLFNNAGQEALAYRSLRYTSELNSVFIPYDRNPPTEYLLDIEFSSECAYHYYYCIGVLNWWDLLGVDFYLAMDSLIWIILEYIELFFEPFFDYSITGWVIIWIVLSDIGGNTNFAIILLVVLTIVIFEINKNIN